MSDPGQPKRRRTPKASRSPESGLSDQELKFCDEYMKDFVGGQAVIRAGYSPKGARVQASRLLSRVNVIEELQRRHKKREKKLDFTLDDVVRELAKIGFSTVKNYTRKEGDALVTDFTNTTDDHLAAVHSVEVDTFGGGKDEDGDDKPSVKRVKVKLFNKADALVNLGKHLGGFGVKGGEDNSSLVVNVKGGLPDDE